MAERRTTSSDEFFKTLGRQTLDGKRALILELGKRPSRRSVEILVELLRVESWYLRELAVRSLTQIGDPATAPLRGLLRSGLWYSRAAAARTLGKIGSVDALPDLVLLLSDSNHTVQGACLASLADLVRAGRAKETARLFWNQGARRAEELGQLLLAVHPDAGGAVVEFLADPSSFLIEEPARDSQPEEERAQDLKNA
jgi:HEAT repeat protein